jgi:L-ascorbate metabolism protein UlaG (beta-lactamase superfamily)
MEDALAIQVTFHGHAAFGLQIGKHHILIDPFFNGNPTTTVKPEEVEADFILVSHGHSDHLGDTVSIAQRTGATVITVAEIASWLRKQAVKVHPQHIGGGHEHPFGHVKLTLALHGSALPDGSYGGNPCGFLITAEGKKIYHAGDTGLFGDMRLIGEEGIDLALLPIGDNYTMGPDDALRAVKLLQPTHVIPMHYGSWDLIKQDAAAWAERVEKETQAKAHVLKAGESFSL